ncbi:MAG: urea ABC transporter ATP-binding protein UrtD [Deltaproteobacteria bacterium]|jgi:urea transport system ATP-binding protein|nr:urea ABC transporter ATP-binding protein UrtD [Deltaproteobacteria bacterium]
MNPPTKGDWAVRALGATSSAPLATEDNPFNQLVLPWTPKALRRRKYILLLEGISVVFEGFKALNNLSLAIKEGELRCVIGPNGAGKTTMMDVITGHARPNKGEAWYRENINLLEEDEVFINQAGIGRKFQKPSVFQSLTVGQNLELALKGKKSVFSTLLARLNGEEADFLAEILTLINLADLRARVAGSLSHGQKQWLEIGLLLAQKPRVLLLDEPVAGLTGHEIDRTTELLLSLEGRHSLIVVEHDMGFVRSIARTVTVLHQGSVLAEGDLATVSANPAVVEAYLGVEAC